MTAQEFIKSDIDIEFDGYTNKTCLHISELEAMLKDFAILKCLEQREICANEVLITNDYGSGGELFDCVDRDSILNSPNPEM